MLLARVARRGNSWFLLWSEGHLDAAYHASGIVGAARKVVHQRYDGFAAPNERPASFLRMQTGHTSLVLRLPNTVDEETFKHAAKNRRELDLASEGQQPRTLLLVSRLQNRKRVHETVAAFRRLPQHSRQQVRLVIAGEGPERAALVSSTQFEPNIKLAGQLSTDQITKLYGEVDGFILLSRRDPNPLSAIEAAFASLPLLLSHEVGNSEELVEAGRNGWVIDANDPGQVDQALQEFFTVSDTELRHMGDASLRIAERSFSRQEVAASFLSQLIETFPPKRAVSND